MSEMAETTNDRGSERVASFLRTAFRPLREARFWLAVAHHLLSFPIAWAAAFVIIGTTVASVGFIPLMLLLPPAALLLARRGGEMERARARAFLGVDVEAPAPRVRAQGFFEWFRITITDAVSWRALGYFVVLFGLGNLAFLAITSLASASVTLLTVPFWGYGAAGFIEHVMALGGGLVLVALTPRVVMGLASLNVRLVRSLLGPAAEVKIRELEGRRSTAVRVADVDRRRIEQDLHDGAQVRLTALALQIGLAREALAEGADEERVAGLLEEAHTSAKQALREIRDLARGIHPAILTDRGLDDALTSMVGRLPVPIELDVDIPERPSPEVESIVYFVAAEAVTNAVRHSDSPTVGLRVVRSDDEITVEVRDRGRGGADPELGTGLASLRHRVEATGGRMTVESPEGVGTLVKAVVPCN